MRMNKRIFIALFASMAVFAACENGPAAPDFTKDAVDLTSEETANCYIVKPSGAFSFTTAYKGNSTTETVSDGVSLTLVWQDAKNLVKELYYDAAEKRAYVLTGDKSGNAVVAVCDGAGKILWSWHLWICNYDPAASLYSTAANASGTVWTFMDRNLGAVSADPVGFGSHGLFYQWGRKDPFPGAATYTEMNDDYTYSKDGEPAIYCIGNNELPTIGSTADFHGSVGKSIENPSVFYKMGYIDTGELDEYGDPVIVNDPLTGDWTDVSNDDYWGGVSMKKTIYDPCPAGYKVPVCDADGNTPYAWLKYTEMTWDKENHGAVQDGQWFPGTGTRVYASGGLDFSDPGLGYNAYSGLWIGTAGKTSSNLELYPDLYGQYMMIINGKRMFKVGKDKRSQGMSLRCVVDAE